MHALLEWSQANGWREPARGAGRPHLELGGGRRPSPSCGAATLLGALPGLARLRLLRGAGPRRAQPGRGADPASEVAETVLRGSIDLLVERRGLPPLIVDYKTDRLDGTAAAELVGRYEIQQAIYALAVAEARGAPEVELAYVFLERPDEPVV